MVPSSLVAKGDVFRRPRRPDRSCGIWLDSKAIVDGASQPLLASTVTFRRLDRDVPQEELDLIQLATRYVTKPRAREPKIVRCQLVDAGARGRRAYHVPKHFRRHAVAPHTSRFVDGTRKTGPCVTSAAAVQASTAAFTQLGIGTVRTWPPLPARSANDPVFLSLLDRLKRQREQLRAAQSASDQHGDHRIVAQRTRRRRPRVFEQPPTLFRRQPVPKPDANAPHAFDTTNPGGQFGTQQTCIRSLVRDTADSCQPQIDGRRGVLAVLEVDPITKNHRTVEREAGFRTIPGDELANRVVVGALTAGGRQGVQHCRLSLFEIGEGQDSLWRFPADRRRAVTVTSERCRAPLAFVFARRPSRRGSRPASPRPAVPRPPVGPCR